MKLMNFLFIFLLFAGAAAANDIVGFWKSIDDKTKRPQSIVGVYEHNGKYYGRLILTFYEDGRVKDTIYEPRERAPGVQGNPFYVGLDFLWDLTKEGRKYVDGQILDPQKGRVYGAQAWRDGNDLIVRGEIFFIGRNQKWPAAADSDFPAGFEKPNLAAMTPKIPLPK